MHSEQKQHIPTVVIVVVVVIFVKRRQKQLAYEIISEAKRGKWWVKS